MMPNPAQPTHQSPRVNGRRRVTYSWTRIIIIFFICLMVFTAVLVVLIRFVIRAPSEPKGTSPTTRAGTTDALSTSNLPTIITAHIATTTTKIIPTIATTSTAHVASSTTNTNVPRTTSKQPGIVNRTFLALVEYYFHIQ